MKVNRIRVLKIKQTESECVQGPGPVSASEITQNT